MRSNRCRTLLAALTLGSFAGLLAASDAEASRRRTNRPPDFPGITLAVANDTDRITLAWLPATDDRTPQDQLVYEVHVSTTPGFVPDATTLQTSLVNQLQAEVSGLTAATEYEVVVVARDAANRGTEDRRTLQTLEFPVVFNPNVPLETTEDLNLGEPTIDGTTYTFAGGPGVTPPTDGAVLVVTVGSDLHLRQVERVTVKQGGAVIEVQTSQGALDDAVDQFALHSAFTLPIWAAEALRRRPVPRAVSPPPAAPGRTGCCGPSRWRAPAGAPPAPGTLWSRPRTSRPPPRWTSRWMWTSSRPWPPTWSGRAPR
jgi:hypothetical protein